MRINQMRLVLAAMCGVFPSTPAIASESPFGLDIVVRDVVTPEQPLTRVEVWARFDSAQYYAFAQVVFQLGVGNGPDFKGSWELQSVIESPWSSRGEVDGTWGQRVDGIVAAQIHQHPYHADPSNPILIWTGVYSTSDFTPRDITLRTIVMMYNVWADEDYWVSLLEQIPINQVETPTAYIHISSGECDADIDGNGKLDLFDFLEFANLFNAGHPDADCDTNGVFDLFDYLCFSNAFNQGC